MSQPGMRRRRRRKQQKTAVREYASRAQGWLASGNMIHRSPHGDVWMEVRKHQLSDDSFSGGERAVQRYMDT